MSTVVVYLGGAGPAEMPHFPDDAVTIIAADSGVDLARAHNVKPNFVVGDLDSVSDESLAWAKEHGSVIETAPSEKDETDCEIALLKAQEFNAEKLLIIGGGGQRTDHLLANISVFCGELTHSWDVRALLGLCDLYVCRPERPVQTSANIDQLVSLVPVHGNAHGVTTSGLKWELTDSLLEAHRARGISNVCEQHEIKVSVTTGNVAVIFSNEE